MFKAYHHKRSINPRNAANSNELFVFSADTVDMLKEEMREDGTLDQYKFYTLTPEVNES